MSIIRTCCRNRRGISVGSVYPNVWLVGKHKQFVGSGVRLIGLRRHRADDCLARLRSPLPGLARITFELSYYLIVVIEDSDFESHITSFIPREKIADPSLK